MLKSLAIAIAVFSLTASAEGISAKRDRQIDYHEYLSVAKPAQQAMQPQPPPGQPGVPQPAQPPAAVDAAVPMDKLDLTALPKWDKMDDVTLAFEMIRDFRFLNRTTNQGFLRRDSWLYPDDGCYARAALAKQNLATWGFTAVKKVFAFGNLTVKTANTPGGVATWWYHVVNGVTVDGQPYVLDPAVEPLKPLSLQEWTERMGGKDAGITLAICDTGTYSPYDTCASPAATSEQTALADQLDFLDQEWAQLVSLNRDPVKELGDQPPWPLRK